MMQQMNIKIEPYWNVNTKDEISSKKIEFIKIEPYWNVNEESDLLGSNVAND